MGMGMLFDCDGTLLDTMSIWHEVHDLIESEIGTVLDSEDARIYNGSPIPDVVSHLVGKYDADPDRMTHLLDTYPLEAYHVAKAKPGVVELLEKIHATGIPCAVLSASPQRFLHPGLEHAGIIRYFDLICSVNDEGLPKTQPHIYHVTCRKLGVDIAQTWFLDDSIEPLRAARSAGLRTAAVRDWTHPGDFETASGIAEVAIDSFEGMEPARFGITRTPVPAR